jgi:hypothetical protein
VTRRPKARSVATWETILVSMRLGARVLGAACVGVGGEGGAGAGEGVS